MKNMLKIIVVLSISLASDCSSPFSFTDNSRLVVEGTLRFSDGTTAANKNILLQTKDEIILAEVASDANGRFFITTPMGNYPIVLYVFKNDILSTSRFPEKLKIYSNKTILADLSGSYYDFGSIEVKPSN